MLLYGLANCFIYEQRQPERLAVAGGRQSSAADDQRWRRECRFFYRNVGFVRRVRIDTLLQGWDQHSGRKAGIRGNRQRWRKFGP